MSANECGLGVWGHGTNKAVDSQRRLCVSKNHASEYQGGLNIKFILNTDVYINKQLLFTTFAIKSKAYFWFSLPFSSQCPNLSLRTAPRHLYNHLRIDDIGV